MKAVNITDNGVIEYYGNKAGYIKNNAAYVDVIFQKDELEKFLNEQNGISVTWQEGVYDNLVSGAGIKEAPKFKNCRIYQLKPTVDMRMKFISYDALDKHGFGNPDIKNYRVVYDGNIGTNDLEEIYMAFNLDAKPEGYSGYSLSVSDIIELYDESGSEFHYVDSIGFVKIEAEQGREMNQKYTDDTKFEDIGAEAPAEHHEDERQEEIKKSENEFETIEATEQNDDMDVETFTIIM